jgi:hypothetical protein
MKTLFKTGDLVIYRKQKYSVHPTLNAKVVAPASNGDQYCYQVDKFWRVIAVQPDQTLLVRTRRGKQLMIAANDPALRRPHWWERLLLKHRFPTTASVE